MLGYKIVYVIDTNILIDYINIILEEDGKQPNEPTIDLSNAHIVIPSVVVRELSKFKGEKTDRGKAARAVLRRLRKMFEGRNIPVVDEDWESIPNIGDVYNLDAPIAVTNRHSGDTQLVSILPVHKNFRNCLPFHPSDQDMDGQIILTAMAASLAMNDMKIDGSELIGTIYDTTFKNVVLLTNDNGLAIRARERGIATSRYGYKCPPPYTGRREVVVPNELFEMFYNDPGHKLCRAQFEQFMPGEPRLVANEFIVMHLADPIHPPSDYNPYYDPAFDCVGRYDQEMDAIMKLRFAKNFPVQPKNVGQAIYAEALLDPDIAAVVCTGPAGSGKTFMATIFGYTACQAGRFIGVTVVPCENRSNIGALPGNLDEKMDPDVQPLKNAIRNYLLSEETEFGKDLSTFKRFGAKNAKSKKCKARDAEVQPSSNGSQSNGGEYPDKGTLKTRLKNRVDLIWDNWFSNIPIESARGRDFAYELAIYDEFQDQNACQADTLIKRIGAEGKIIITGDIGQIHSPYLDQDNNGLIYASRQLYDNPMVAQVCFNENEVVRHPLVQEIARRQKERGTTTITS